jgi:hypothetical protein
VREEIEVMYLIIIKLLFLNLFENIIHFLRHRTLISGTQLEDIWIDATSIRTFCINNV